MILRYSNPGDWILDQFTGSGTTLIEAKLLNRNAVGIDINPQSVSTSEKNIHFESDSTSKIIIREGNAIKLDFLKDEKIDFICTHPPYANIIQYSDGIQGDISLLNTEDFLDSMVKVAKESFRVLKKRKMCAVMMGDIRKNGRIVPLGFNIMQIFIKEDFQLKEIIIKEQHNCRTTSYWKNINHKLLLLAHEYIFIFQK